MHVDRRVADVGTVTRADRRHDDHIEKRRDRSAVNDTHGLLEFGTERKSHPAVVEANFLDVDTDDLDEILPVPPAELRPASRGLGVERFESLGAFGHVDSVLTPITLPQAEERSTVITRWYRPDMRLIILTIVGSLIAMTVANVATTVFLHRALAHRALTLRGPVRFAFRVLIWISTGIKPREWVAVHRKHHAYTDVEGDPHSPVLLGWRRVQFTNVVLYRRAARDPETLRYARDLPSDRWDRVLFDRSLLGLAIGIAILTVALGPAAGGLVAFGHTVLYIGGSAAVNGIGHHFGRRPYSNGAGNLQWLAFLTAGEGLHNNHHAAPTSAKLSHRWYEIDPGWWCIKVLTWVRLASVRLTAPRLA